MYRRVPQRSALSVAVIELITSELIVLVLTDTITLTSDVCRLHAADCPGLGSSVVGSCGPAGLRGLNPESIQPSHESSQFITRGSFQVLNPDQGWIGTNVLFLFVDGVFFVCF